MQLACAGGHVDLHDRVAPDRGDAGGGATDGGSSRWIWITSIAAVVAIGAGVGLALALGREEDPGEPYAGSTGVSLDGPQASARF